MSNIVNSILIKKDDTFMQSSKQTHVQPRVFQYIDMDDIIPNPK